LWGILHQLSALKICFSLKSGVYCGMKNKKNTKKTATELRAFYEAKIASETAKKAELWKTLGNCHIILGPPKNSRGSKGTKVLSYEENLER
jgi:hypothetical protein